jgi:predicted kinase
MPTSTLFFLCGKMAAGKSTLSRQLAERADAVLLEQDHFLATLFPGEIVDIPRSSSATPG